MFAKMDTFTVVVHVYPWMKSESEASKQLLLAYLVDLGESMEFRNHVIAAALTTSPTLWFTFVSEEDAKDFRYVVELLYQTWEVSDANRCN